MGIKIEEHDDFCISEFNQMATEFHYMRSESQDAFDYFCRIIGKATGPNQKQQASIAQRCWIACTEAFEEREHEQVERASEH